VKLICAIAAAGAIALAAPTAAIQADVTQSPPYVVDCVHRVEGPPHWPPRGWRQDAVLAGPVAFVGLRDYARQPANRDDGSVGSKTVALVRADAQVTVVARAPGLRLRWGDFRARSAITFKACPARQRSLGFRLTHRRFVGRHTQFIGGFSAPAPTCAAIDVYVLGRARPYRREFGFGRHCG
jgi:hypothetical protein